MEKDKCCGKCRYHRCIHATDDWVCVNGESEVFGLETEYDDVCQDFEAPDKKPNIR